MMVVNGGSGDHDDCAAGDDGNHRGGGDHDDCGGGDDGGHGGGGDLVTLMMMTPR